MQYSFVFVFATAIVISGLMPLSIFAASSDEVDSAGRSTKNDGGSAQEFNKKNDTHKKSKPQPAMNKDEGSVTREKHEKAIVNPCHGDPRPSWCE